MDAIQKNPRYLFQLQSKPLPLYHNLNYNKGKTYESEHIDLMRYGVFKNNLEIIEKHNQEYQKGRHTYRLGANVGLKKIFYFFVVLF
jgi:hypothetical protein